jgi:hypothetical protein
MKKTIMTAWLAGVVVASGSAWPAAAEDKAPDRNQLTAELIAKGEKLKESDKEAARTAFNFARLYAAADKTAEVQVQLKALGEPPKGFTDPEIMRIHDAIYWTTAAYYSNYPPRAAAMDLTNLRMLLDEELVGNLRSLTGRTPLGAFAFFRNYSKLTLAEVRRKYGPPTTEVQDQNGQEILTYGVLRVVGKFDGTVAVVMFAPP